MAHIIGSSTVLIYFGWFIVFGIALALNMHFLFWFLEELSDTNDKCNPWIKTLQGLMILVQSFFGELPMYYASGWFLGKIGHVHAMSVSLFGQGLVMLLISYLQEPWWILAIIPFQGAVFGLHYATAATYANFVAPNAQATIQVIIYLYLYFYNAAILKKLIL